MSHFETQVCLWQCDWEGGKPNDNGVQHKSPRDSGQLLLFPVWSDFNTFSFRPWYIALTHSLIAVKFNGKQTGSHKANNAQRLTEVKYFETHLVQSLSPLSTFLVQSLPRSTFLVNRLIVQLFSGSGAFCCSCHWQWGDGLSCCWQGDLQLWQGDHQLWQGDHQPDCGRLKQPQCG